MKLTLLTTLLLVTNFVLAEDTAQDAFCKYTVEQASMQRDLLRTPSVAAGPTLPPGAGLPPQMVLGLTSSLVDVKKSSLTMKAAHTTCDLYSATTEAQMHIAFAVPQLEKDALGHRLDLLQKAATSLDAMVDADTKLVEAQNLTRPAVYYIVGARMHLETSRTATLTALAATPVPTMSTTPLQTLVGNKVQAESDNTEALIRLQKQSGWDLQLSGGVHRQLTQITPDVSATGLYGTFNLVYNLGHHAAGKHLDKSATTYADWKDKQFDEVVNQATILKKQLNATLTAQLGQLKVLSSYDEALQKDIVSLGTIDTSNVIAYRSQLLADQIVLHVDIGDMQFRIARLQEYLTTNF